MTAPAPGMRSLLLAVSSAFLLAAPPVSASQLYAGVSYGYGPASGFQSGQDVASIPLSEFMLGGGTIDASVAAEAHSGYLGFGTYALLSTQNSAPILISEAQTTAFAQIEDVLTAGGGPPGSGGFLVLEYDVSGSNGAVLTGDPSVGTAVGDAHAVLQGCTLDPAAVTPLPQAACADSVADLGAPSYSHDRADLTLPFQFGVPFAVVVSMTSIASVAFDPSHTLSFSGSSDFLDTASLVSVQLQDENHQPVASPTLLAESGTTYPVPEPSRALLLVADGLVLVALARRTSRG